jgi:signal transduction histidine kinase
VYEVPGLAGDQVDAYLAACRQAAARGGGWAEYEWLRPGGEAGLVWKTAWVVPLDDGYLGCSVFRSGPAAASAAAAEAVAQPA